MPLNRRNTRKFYKLFSGQGLKSVYLLKRSDDQRQGTVVRLKLFNCKRGRVTRTGQTVQADMSSDTTAVWVIPVSELNRVGVAYLNAMDRVQETTYDDRVPLPYDRYWQPESEDQIEVALFENVVLLHCRRVDPPNEITKAGKG